MLTLSGVQIARTDCASWERSSGLGRNCAMFDAAHREVYGLHDPAIPMDDWHRIVVQHCHQVHRSFDDALGGPLPFSEVQSTASSIARWTRRNFISKSEYQAKRGRIGGIKSGEKRRQAREAQITEVFG